MGMRSAAFVAFVALAVPACTPPQGAVAAQQVAQELNVDARFGRTEIAMDHVAPAARFAAWPCQGEQHVRTTESGA